MMALDVLRAIAKSEGTALQALHSRITTILDIAEHSSALSAPCSALRSALSSLASLRLEEVGEAGARDLALSLARTYVGALLVEHAAATGEGSDKTAAVGWCGGRQLVPVVGRRQEYTKEWLDQQRGMVYCRYDQGATFPEIR